MGTITLPNVRTTSDVTMPTRLKDGGVAIDWTTLTHVKAWLYSDEQRALAGRCDVSIDPEDNTVLVCEYVATKPQYLGVNRIIVQAVYNGRTKTYDKPAFTFVPRTADVAGEEVTLDDPVVDVEIEVQDVSSSVLDAAVNAAIKAADEVDQALITHTGPQGDSAYEVAVENGFEGTEEEWLASLKGDTGETGPQGIQGEPGEQGPVGPAGVDVVDVTVGPDVGTPSAVVSLVDRRLAITFNGIKGEQGNSGYQGAAGELELVNNDTDGGETAAWSAERGKLAVQRIGALEDQADAVDAVLDVTEIETAVERTGRVAKLFINQNNKFQTAGSSAYVIDYWAVLVETKFRVIQSINNSAVALGRIGYVNSVEDIANDIVPTMLKSTGLATAEYDTVVTVPAGKIMCVSTHTAASVSDLTVKKIAYESSRIASDEAAIAALADSLPRYPKRGVNLIQESAILEGYYTQANGTYRAGSGFCAIEVYFARDDMRIYMNRIYSGYFCLFDKDGNITESGDNASANRKMYNGFRLPKGTVRGRFTSQSSKANILAHGFISYYHVLTEGEIQNRVSYEESYTNTQPEVAPTDYNGRELSTFKHICCIGDSLTAGVMNASGEGELDYAQYSYPEYLKIISGTDVINMGRGGATANSWWERFQDDPRLTGIDCAIIQLGVNDTLANWETYSVPAFINIVNRLKQNNKNMFIFLAGIINAQSYQCSDSDDGALYTKDQAIRAMYEENWADDDHVIFVDWAKWGHLRDLYPASYLSEKDNYNSGHLSALGYNRLAQDYYNYLGWIMHNDDTTFRLIQFIGTDLTY